MAAFRPIGQAALTDAVCQHRFNRRLFQKLLPCLDAIEPLFVHHV